MERLAPGRFGVTIAGEARTVIMSLGVRSEILRMITKKQLEYRSISSRQMLPPEMRAKLAETVETLESVRQSKAGRPVPPEAGLDEETKKKYAVEDQRIEDLQTDVNRLYEESIQILDDNKDKITEALTIGMIDLTDDAIAAILAIMLTKRGPTGEVTEAITKDMILYDDSFIEASDELLELVEAGMEYLTSAIKKISAVSNMVSSLVRPD